MVAEALLPEGSVAVTVWVPGDVLPGMVTEPLPLPLELVVIVPRVTAELWRTMVNVSLAHVPEMVTVMVPPGATEVGLTDMVTVQVTGP
jgi:hypothetical protein